MSLESCGTCKYWKVNTYIYNNDISQGYCRRNPPMTIVAPVRTAQGIQPAPIAVFPNLDKTDWCGEYRGRVVLQ